MRPALVLVLHFLGPLHSLPSKGPIGWMPSLVIRLEAIATIVPPNIDLGRAAVSLDTLPLALSRR